MAKFVTLSILGLIVGGQFVVGDNAADSWSEFGREVKHIWTNCTQRTVAQKFACIKRGSLLLLDAIANQPTIPLTSDVRLVVRRLDRVNTPRTSRHQKQLILLDQPKSPKCDTNGSIAWSSHVLDRIAKTFDSHILQIDFAPSVKAEETGRHRHRRQQMMPMMTFGIVAFGMIFVPLGFQFLAVLGGKAFLMAKMALLLASINGLKRVATSGVHYGFYHPAPEPPPPQPVLHGHGAPLLGSHHAHQAWYDRDGGAGPRANTLA